MTISLTASRLGINAFSKLGSLEQLANSTAADIELIILAVYRHVLGNIHLMKHERLSIPETQLLNGDLTVRGFVQAVAKSELYKKKYVYPNFHSRVIELNFKHLLGRAPYDQYEISEHLERYQKEGYDADIDSYIYSQEYETSFGEYVVPYYRDLVTTGTNQKTAGFTRFFQLYRGYATSDRSQLGGPMPRLAEELALNSSSTIIPPSRDRKNIGWAYKAAEKGTLPKRAFQSSQSSSRMYRIEVAGMNLSRFPKVRRINKEFIVPFNKLYSTLQKIKKAGGTIASITAA